MRPATIADLVADVVARRLDLAGCTLDRSARLVEDLGADSVAVVELTLALEEAFDIDIADDHIERLRTVQDAVDYVERALRWASPAPQQLLATHLRA